MDSQETEEIKKEIKNEIIKLEEKLSRQKLEEKIITLEKQLTEKEIAYNKKILRIYELSEHREKLNKALNLACEIITYDDMLKTNYDESGCGSFYDYFIEQGGKNNETDNQKSNIRDK